MSKTTKYAPEVADLMQKNADKSACARRLRTARKVLFAVIAVVVMVVVAFPIVWVVTGAFKGYKEIWDIPPHWWPKNFTWDNFKTVFKVDRQTNFGMTLLSTGAVALMATAGSLFVNTLAAYVFARIEFPFKKVLWALYLFPMFVPGITILLTSLKVVNSLGLVDSIWVLVVPGLASAYQTFFFRQFFLGVPASYEEAAELDGCNKLQIFFKIFLPMSATPLVIQGVNIFLAHWNSYMWPALTVTGNTNLMQVMQVIASFRTRYAGNYGVVIAASLISMTVPTLIFIFAQKKIVQGIALSGIK